MSTYRYGDMVFAKCQNYPYWPGKVIRTFPNSNSYKVLFYGEKSEAIIDIENIIPFNEESHKRFSSETAGKKDKSLKFSLNLSMKIYIKRKKGLEEESGEEEVYQ
jgi:hypothetical protein